MSRAARLGGALLCIGVLLFVAWLVWKSILLSTGKLGNKTGYDAVRITLPVMTVWDIEFSADSKLIPNWP